MSSTVRHRPGHAAAAALTVLALSCTALLLGGCGDGRVTPPSLTATARPNGFVRVRYPADGVALQVPRDWTVTAGKAPLVAVISSGPAVIALWRYPSPSRPAAITSSAVLARALSALVSAAKARDPGLKLQRTGLSHLGAAGAVIIDAIEQIAGKPRRVRTEHIYVDGAELVLDTYAPPAQFPSDDHAVFSPVRKSLSLLNDGRPAAGTATVGTATVGTATVGTPAS